MKKFLMSLFVLSTTAHAFDWQGHRGARGLYPENTIGAMKEGLKYPITTLELDVVVTADKKVIVSHEPYMSPEICTHTDAKISEKSHNIYKMKYDEVVKFDCGSKPHPRFPQQQKINVGKPLLSALISEIEKDLKLSKRVVSYNIEIKSSPEQEKEGAQPPFEEFAELVVKTIREQLPPERFTIQCFDWRVLKYLKKTKPEISLVALREEAFTFEEVQQQLGFMPAVFSPFHELLDQEKVKAFHEAKVKVIPWTVNDVETMKKLIAMGVDGIITDYPNLISSALAKDCGRGRNLYEGKCVDIPKHAEASDKNPGWVCKKGYVQEWLHCRKVRLPKNAKLLEDGKNWECEEGFERYRSTCRKLNKK